MSCSASGPARVAVEQADDPEHPVARLHRHREDGLRHVSGLLGRLPGESRVAGHVADGDRLAGLHHPAGDALSGRDPHPGHVLSALARGDRVEQLGVIVAEQGQRACRRAEQPPRRLGERPQQLVGSGRPAPPGRASWPARRVRSAAHLRSWDPARRGGPLLPEDGLHCSSSHATVHTPGALALSIRPAELSRC